MNLKKLYNESVRVFKVTKKPTWNEFKKVVPATESVLGAIVAIYFNNRWQGVAELLHEEGEQV